MWDAWFFHNDEISLVLVDNFNVVRARVIPYENNAPLGIDADGVISRQILTQPLQPIAGWARQVFQTGRNRYEVKLTLGNAMQFRWKGFAGSLVRSKL